jgi:hypothetical protein
MEPTIKAKVGQAVPDTPDEVRHSLTYESHLWLPPRFANPPNSPSIYGDT